LKSYYSSHQSRRSKQLKKLLQLSALPWDKPGRHVSSPWLGPLKVYFLELQSTINLYIELDAQLGNLAICRFANPATGQRSNQLNYVPSLFSAG
jgi:hypothetical protein